MRQLTGEAPVAIIGAGVAGLALAVLLRRRVLAVTRVMTFYRADLTPLERPSI